MVDPSVHAFFDKQLQLSANQKCCDGAGTAPRWASVSHGIYISIEASGVHRGLGVKTSFVQSLYLDAWKPVHLKMMELGGNERFNRFMKAQGVPDDMPIQEKYCTRAARWYREALRAEAEGLPSPEPLKPGTGCLPLGKPVLEEPVYTSDEGSDAEAPATTRCMSWNTGILLLLSRATGRSMGDGLAKSTCAADSANADAERDRQCLKVLLHAF